MGSNGWTKSRNSIIKAHCLEFWSAQNVSIRLPNKSQQKKDRNMRKSSDSSTSKCLPYAIDNLGLQHRSRSTFPGIGPTSPEAKLNFYFMSQYLN